MFLAGSLYLQPPSSGGVLHLVGEGVKVGVMVDVIEGPGVGVAVSVGGRGVSDAVGVPVGGEVWV